MQLPSISGKLEFRYIGNLLSEYQFPCTSAIIDVTIEQANSKCLLCFDFAFPGLPFQPKVAATLLRTELDIDNFVWKTQFIFLEQDCFLLTGEYMIEMPNRGFERWWFAGKMKGNIIRNNVRYTDITAIAASRKQLQHG